MALLQRHELEPVGPDLTLVDTPLTHDNKQYDLFGSVYVHPSLSEEDLEGFELNPVVQPIQGLGRVTLEAVRKTGGTKTEPTRVHRLYGIEINGYKHAAEVTDPANGEAEHAIVSLPGLTEHISSHLRQTFHENIAEHHPTAKIISVETDGIGGIGDHYDPSNPEERKKHGHVGMALSRLALSKALGGNKPQVLVATSQGSVIGHRMAMENLFGEPVNGPINLIGQVYVSPALVDPSRSRKVMNDAFALKFLFDVGTELAFRSSLKERYEAARSIGTLTIGREDIQAVRFQISQLRKGTPEKDVERVFKTIPTLVIQGTHDAVGENEMYDRLEKRRGSKLHLVRVPRRGHEIAMKPHKLFDKLHRTPAYQKFFSAATKAGKARPKKAA